MEASKKEPGADYPDTLTSMGNLAFTWKKQGSSVEAVSLMQECVWLCQLILPPNHPCSLHFSAALVQWQVE